MRPCSHGFFGTKSCRCGPLSKAANLYLLEARLLVSFCCGQFESWVPGLQGVCIKLSRHLPGSRLEASTAWIRAEFCKDVLQPDTEALAVCSRDRRPLILQNPVVYSFITFLGAWVLPCVEASAAWRSLRISAFASSFPR